MIYSNSKYKVEAVHADTQEIIDAYWNTPRADQAVPIEPLNLYDGVSEYRSWYTVTNLETGVAEHRCTALPEALSAAHNLEDQLINQPWITALEDHKRFRRAMQEDVMGANEENTATIPGMN